MCFYVFKCVICRITANCRCYCATDVIFGRIVFYWSGCRDALQHVSTIPNAHISETHGRAYLQPKSVYIRAICGQKMCGISDALSASLLNTEYCTLNTNSHVSHVSGEQIRVFTHNIKPLNTNYLPRIDSLITNHSSLLRKKIVSLQNNSAAFFYAETQ